MKTNIHFKNINKLAIPALIAGIAEPLLSITDTAIIGNMESNATESLAAVGIVGAFISMLVWVFGQVRSAISSIISQYVGAHKLEEVNDLPVQATAIVLLGSFLVLAISYPFATQIFEFYNATGMILDSAVMYFKIRIFGFPFSLFVFAIFGTFRGLQNTYYPMLIAITGALLNIVLDIVLVYGIEGIIAPMHIEGAAYASVLSQIVMAGIAASLLVKKTSISLKVQLPFNKEIKRMLGMISNLFIRTIALNVALYFGTSYATSYGKEYIAAYTIGLNIWFLGAFMIDGYSSAGNILSGKLLGAKDYQTLLKLSRKLTKYGFVIGGCLTIFGGLFYESIGTVFTKDPVVLEKFYASFWIILAMQPLCAITFIFDGMYKGMGEMKILRNLLLLSTGVVFIPVLLVFDAFDYKLHAIWIAFTCWIVVRGFPLILLFRWKFIPLAQKK
ncbi:MAG: MATE family efflux transporter [Polaribacter sp.]|nr:MATE family efflux transporter [Polaribacter sp.]MBT5099597.1 MATE family efflux transporter [Polaribacter sp.]MBT5644928.1 MATE family efflux transporter [Polaribacter sp.]MBT7704302.1 MATE family efflux transporter [Polaribacter sp.]MDG1221876.1 MATE family efflux transporter [Polaribacter sp.]